MKALLILVIGLLAQSTQATPERSARADAAASVEPLRVETTIGAMGGSFSIIAYGADRVKLTAATNAAAEEIQRLEELMSNYIPTSEWSILNRDAAKSPVRVSRETFDLIRACVDYSKASGGAFDITVGPLMKVWGFYKGSGKLPHRAEIRTALSRVGAVNILLDEPTLSIRFARDGVEVDPGGIGKGYAVDRAVAILRDYGIQSALVTAARSSIGAIGVPPGPGGVAAKGWKVEIRDPKDASRVVESVFLRDQSMSTSGNYEKFFRAGGTLYSHIMDPRTGYPAQGMLSVSVIAPLCVDSEAWTKPVYIRGREWARSNLPKGFRAYLCEDHSTTSNGPFQPAQGEKNLCAWLQ